MNKKFLSKMKDLLLLQKEEILSAVVKNVDVDTDGDETDEIQGKLLIQLTNHLNIRNANKLLQIDVALKKIDDRSYGVCVDCEEDILEKRLLSNPYFQRCVDCAEEREKQDKQRKKE